MRLDLATRTLYGEFQEGVFARTALEREVRSQGTYVRTLAAALGRRVRVELPGETVEDLLARAGEGLAQAKRDGGNRVTVVSTPEARKRAA